MSFVEYTGDIGANLNLALSQNPMGGRFLLPNGDLRLGTKIDLDILHSSGTLIVEGCGCGMGYEPGGTRIDATGFSDSVFSSKNSHLGGIYLRDFSLCGGKIGFDIKNAAGTSENFNSKIPPILPGGQFADVNSVHSYQRDTCPPAHNPVKVTQ